jgi:hypothetical protein
MGGSYSAMASSPLPSFVYLSAYNETSAREGKIEKVCCKKKEVQHITPSSSTASAHVASMRSAPASRQAGQSGE